MNHSIRRLAIAAAVFAVHAASAATITVTSTADGIVADGNCTLREAITSANTDTAIDACTAGSGADTIVLGAGTYTLSVAGANENANATGDLDITSNITLSGADPASTIISGAGLDRVIHVLSTGTATIQHVTIRDGASQFGGGVYNAGTTTLRDCIVTANSATAGNGGGSGGVAGGGGGGVFNASGATLVFDTCSITNNSAIGGTGQSPSVGGGGGGGGAAGGGVFNDGGTITGTALTVTGNHATGGNGGNGTWCDWGTSGAGGGGIGGIGGNGVAHGNGNSALGGGGGAKGYAEEYGYVPANGGSGGFASGGGGEWW